MPEVDTEFMTIFKLYNQDTSIGQQVLKINAQTPTTINFDKSVPLEVGKPVALEQLSALKSSDGPPARNFLIIGALSSV